MTTVTPTTTPTSFTDLYVRIQQFYAGQVRLLDGMRAEEFAATFTDAGRFDHAPGTPPLQGRRAIAEEMRRYQEARYAADPCQRRHWFNMLEVFPGPDGTVSTEYYALVLLTRPNEPVPVAAPSCLVRDVLVDRDGELRVQERTVLPDYAI
ncbi:nuclear transport factor 2 family protein [Micromonospora sp. NPDC002296]|uniref:nuclear transport factor 2 family protein n=1 Tax=Micromonospora sp. NPDC002296 TaxID=3154271 RepID=UPI00331C3409